MARRYLQLRAGPWSDAVVMKTIKDQTTALRPAGLRTIAKCFPHVQPCTHFLAYADACTLVLNTLKLRSSLVA